MKPLLLTLLCSTILAAADAMKLPEVEPPKIKLPDGWVPPKTEESVQGNPSLLIWTTDKNVMAFRQSTVFTHDEWEKMIKDDEVNKFIEAVNAGAVADPLWTTNYRAAHYSAFTKQVGLYFCKKYNNGQPFTIKVRP